MKILIIASASFAPFFLANQPGDVIDMPEEISKDLIEAGCAEEVKEESQEAPKELVTEKEKTVTKEAETPKEESQETSKKTAKK